MTPVAEAAPFHNYTSRHLRMYISPAMSPPQLHVFLLRFLKVSRLWHYTSALFRVYTATPWRSEYMRRNLKETLPRPPTHTHSHSHAHRPRIRDTQTHTDTHTHTNTHREFFSVKARIHIIATKGGRVLCGSPTPPHPSGYVCNSINAKPVFSTHCPNSSRQGS